LIAAALYFAAFVARADEPELSWDDLQNVKTHVAGEQSTVDFVPPLVALNGKQVTVRGWIVPINLNNATTVTSFILTGTPGTCPFCFGAGPESFLLVTASKPIPVDVAAELDLKGRFETVQNDPTGFYYRLRDATVK